ncbi:hypothetical protein GF369_00315 [Candidatus Peregrinibacteria bacterium]|nr:hypothetical protein [Candidatus Peregrinibacteria bacterium]
MDTDNLEKYAALIQKRNKIVQETKNLERAAFRLLYKNVSSIAKKSGKLEK